MTVLLLLLTHSDLKMMNENENDNEGNTQMQVVPLFILYPSKVAPYVYCWCLRKVFV